MNFRVKLDERWKLVDKLIGEQVLAKRKEMFAKTLLNQVSNMGEQAIREQFHGGRHLTNAALTAEIKGHDNPLVDTKGVYKSIDNRWVDDNVKWVGVPRDARRTHYWLRSLSAFDAAVVVHDGKSIRVTDKMRAMFQILFEVSEGKTDPSNLTGRAAELYARNPGLQWRPLKPSKRVIKIPPRKFVLMALTRSRLKRRCRILFRQLARDFFQYPGLKQAAREANP